MGLFDALFGRKPDTKETLIRSIAALRIRTDPASKVLGYDEKMLDGLSKEQIFMLPEASIVTIVETFVDLRRKGVPARRAIEAIDEYRAQTFGPLQRPLPTSIYDFVAARIGLEHNQGAKLDEEFIDNVVHTSASVFGLEIDMPERPPYITHLQIEIAQYQVVLASYKRRERGYLFPWRVMAFEKRTGEFAFSFNLEVTPISCCFGSHQANGSHFNLGEADPDLTQAEFEEWVLPRLIKRIYGDALLSEQELHAFAVNFVASDIVKNGFEIEFVEEDPGVDPQILAASPDGTPTAIVVRCAVFPETASLSQQYEQFEVFSRNQFDSEILFAGVSVANADARNDIERRAVTREGRFNVRYIGLEAC